jgi:hypothetical protein
MIHMRKPRTAYLKSFINIKHKRWQHAHTLLPAHSLHISSLQDHKTATHIHVSTYRLHFTISIYKTNKQTHILKKLNIPDFPLQLTSNSTLLHYNINTRIRTALRIENIQILYSTNKLHHTMIKHLHNFKGVLDNVTNGPVPQQFHLIYLLKMCLTLYFSFNYRLPV